MKAIVRDLTEDGSVSVIAKLGDESEVVLATIPAAQVAEEFGEEEDYEKVTEFAVEELTEVLGLDFRHVAGLRRAVYQLVAPGPGYDDRIEFEV